MSAVPRSSWSALVALALALVGCEGEASSAGAAAAERPPVPVEVAAVERGPLRLVRTVTGSVEAAAQFVVAPQVAGSIASLEVDLGDRVERGQIVATLVDAEFAQAELEAAADLAVAVASRAEAEAALEIAQRALEREEALREQGVTSESALDAARAEVIAGRARLQVSAARLSRAQASLDTARIRLGYTRVRADWSGGDDARVVAERFVDGGATVPANTPLFSIVEVDPVLAVVFVSERDYGRLRVGQLVELTTDAAPGRVFEGRVVRIAPVFRRSTRQARVEVELPNEDVLLKPGMFVRAELELERREDATHVPFAALTEREGRTGVFVLADDGAHVRWQPVELGIVEGERAGVQDGLTGRVVVLGQALCEDGARVSVVER
ncbi:MAG TPA: efflux RND transporter periplasmic adaptor subunit [Planctomycetota bacterium]|nr:efflux RND transporter periplasmic adaptor subunit [Planctomycetota bacterium]